MTPAEMKTRLAQTLHRSDLTGQMGNFMADAMERINRDFQVSLVLPSDSMPLPAADLLFYYAALQSAFEYLNDGDNAMYAGKRYEQEVSWEGVSNTGKPTDQFSGLPPIIVGV